MNQLYDSREPNVIDEEMLIQAVEEQDPKRQAGKISHLQDVDFKEITHLRLDFKNILRIDNLWQCNNITKLQLDNNLIENIEGLESLINLQWLDLSFNNIEVIKGLDTLTKLEDLSICNNRISRLENMDSLKNLQILSAGDNSLDQLPNMVYLRTFPRLSSLNLRGNPLCEDEQYKFYIAAYLPNLVYLDFRRLDDNTKEQAFQKYHYLIEELKHNENIALQKKEEHLQKEKMLALHKAAFVDTLDDKAVFDNMFSEDTDGAILQSLPEMSGFADDYRQKFVDICRKIFEYGLQQYKKREEEVDDFTRSVNEVKSDNRQAASAIISDFEKENAQLLEEVQQITDAALLDAKILEHSQKINNMWDALMKLEIQLLDQLECRELENNYHEKLLEVLMSTFDKIVKNELKEELSEDLRLIFTDKDSLVNAASASHDIHLLKIDNKEDDIISRANTWMATFVQRVQDEEVKRNRARVTEINHYVDYLHEELQNQDIQDSL
ncbi:dynein regulatory complex subunit 3 isoform X2 [Petromyzon marinus]|uniref:dynein regulatory complex subunit 3 isoform X2 n=1 Tax=Petromyzon marinus TaxID=7757 RepID=UPI003F7285D5